MAETYKYLHWGETWWVCPLSLFVRWFWMTCRLAQGPVGQPGSPHRWPAETEPLLAGYLTPAAGSSGFAAVAMTSQITNELCFFGKQCVNIKNHSVMKFMFQTTCINLCKANTDLKSSTMLHCFSVFSFNDYSINC